MATVLTEDAKVLNALAHSKLADIPQPLITENQIQRVMRGEKVRPTPEQRTASMRIAAEKAWFSQRTVNSL